MNESDSITELFVRVRDQGLKSKGGRAAAESIVRALGPDVMRLCMYRTNGRRADAEDLFQETFAALFVQLSKGVVPASIGAYVATLVRRRSHKRYQPREQIVDCVFDQVESSQESLEDVIVDRLDLQTLADQLPLPMRRVVLGTIVDGATTKRLADELQTSEDNVRQLRSRAVSMVAKLRAI
jgi:RNA polymerase sigma factor (sigma-70 family)